MENPIIENKRGYICPKCTECDKIIEEFDLKHCGNCKYCENTEYLTYKNCNDCSIRQGSCLKC